MIIGLELCELNQVGHTRAYCYCDLALLITPPLFLNQLLRSTSVKCENVTVNVFGWDQIQAQLIVILRHWGPSPYCVANNCRNLAENQL